MSIARMNLAWTARGLGANEKLVLMALADIADDQGICWPSMAHVGGKCDCSERTVRRVIRKLEERGLVATEISKGRSSNRYIIIPDPDKLTVLNPDKTAGLDPDKVTGIDSQPGQTGSPTRTQLCPPNHQEPPITTLTNVRVVSARDQDPVPKQKRKTRIPENAVPSEGNYLAASKRGLCRERADDEYDRFKNHHLAKGTTFLDWDRAWLTWLDSPYRNNRVRRSNSSSSERSARLGEFAAKYF